jgi:transposase
MIPQSQGHMIPHFQGHIIPQIQGRVIPHSQVAFYSPQVVACFHERCEHYHGSQLQKASIMAYKEVQTVTTWEILRRWADHQPLTAIAASVGCDRKTIRSYIELARTIGLNREDFLPERKEEILPRLQEAASRRVHAKATGQMLLEPHVAEILTLINDGEHPLKPKTAFQVISRRYELTGKVSYSSFKRLARGRGLSVKARRSTCRIETRPGEQTQIDYAKVGLLWDPLEKRRRVVYAFIATLGFSRHKFIQFVFTQDQASFTQSHVDMASWFGGVTKVLTIDNLKTGVLKPHIYDPVLNRAYADFAEHYHTHIDPCRTAAPRDKGKVERDVQTVRELYRMLVTEHPSATLGDLNRSARSWLLEEYGTRDHGTTGEPPLERFRGHEHQALIPLPAAPYTIARWAEAVVHPDHYIQALGHRISLPTEYIGKTVQVMITPKLAKVYRDNDLVKTRALIPGQTIHTDDEDFPATVQFALSEKTPRWLIRTARESGGAAFEELVTGLLSVPGFSYMRRVLGLRDVAKGYSFEVVEHAAKRALALDKPINTHLFRHMLESIRREQQEAPSLEGLPLSQTTESFMRSADYFRSQADGREVANG